MALRPFFLALQFLTRIPVPRHDSIEDKDLGYSLVYYPVAGLVIGGLLAFIAIFFSSLLPSNILAAVLLVIWIIITGALHIDGLADTADAWVGGLGDPKKTLDIMKDPSCGPVGVTAVFSVLLLKYVALSQLSQSPSSLAISILLIPVLARAFLILLFISIPYVREAGLGSVIKRHFPRSIAQSVFLISMGFIILLVGLKGVILIFITMLVFLLLGYFVMQRLGGMTGDTAGAMVEIIEAIGLIVLAVS